LIEALAQQGELAGKYDEVLVVGGVKIQVSGIIIDGVVRIGTAYVVKE
jgi:prefoldin subunit 5